MRLLLLAALILVALPAEALTVRAGSELDIPPGTVISEDLYVAGGEVRVRGRVDGDLVVAGGNVAVSGEVRDDLTVAGGDVAVSGRVGETIRAFGGDVIISGNVGKDLVVAGGKIEQLAGSRVGGEAALRGGTIAVRGTIVGPLEASGGDVLIDGRVGGAEVEAGDLVVTAGARIEGPLNYTAKEEADIRPGAVITGPVVRDLPEEGWRFPAWGGWLFLFLAGLISAMLVAAVIPGGIAHLGQTLRRSPGFALLIGAALLFGVPVVALMLMITLIGIPLALFLLGIYLMGLYLAWILAALALGDALLHRAPIRNLRGRMLLAALVGVALLLALQAIPWVGVLVMLLALMAGFGGLIVALTRWRTPQSWGSPR